MIKEKSLLDISKELNENKKNKNNFKLKLFIMSNYSTQFLEKSIKLSGLNNNINLEILSPGYNQWEFSIVNFDNIEKKYNPDFILITLSSLLLILGKKDLQAKNIYNHLTYLIGTLLKKTKASIIFTELEIFEEDDFFSIGYNDIKSLNEKLKVNFKNKVHFLNYDYIIKYLGFKNWTSKKFLISSKLNFNPNYSYTLGNFFFRFIHSIKSPTIRHIILDLDNTLWGGIVGDLGYENVDLSYESYGIEFIKFQEFILSLKKKGLILSICSKNTENIALKVFEKRKEMVLKKEDFSCIKINWKPKSENIAEIFKELNITENGTCFIDDSKFEREEVKKKFKDIYIPEMPNEIIDWINYLKFSNNFISHDFSQSKIDRATFYNKEKIRDKDKQKFSNINKYLKSLNLRISVEKIKSSNQRSFELINKTNQFNFYTNRYTPIQFKKKISKHEYAYNFSLKDKYSDYGEIAVLIAEIDKKNQTSKILDFVMSCRAMSRSAENAILEHYFKFLKKNKIKTCLCDLIITDKNNPIHNLLENFNFKLTTKSKKLKKYSAKVDKFKAVNNFIIFIK